MNIYAISDTHGNLDGLDPQGSDIVVMAGDLAPLHGWDERALLIDEAEMFNRGGFCNCLERVARALQVQNRSGGIRVSGLRLVTS